MSNKSLKTPKSLLFVPANRVERFDKALSAGADVVIVDLEDAVPPDLKLSSRDALTAWLNANPTKDVMIRINAYGTPWFADDSNMAQLANVSGIVLAKAETPEQIHAITQTHPIPIYALIETPLGMANARQIATTPHVKALIFGSIDFQLEMNMNVDYDGLLSFRNELVLASALAKIDPPIDGVTVEINDSQVLQSETLKAKNLGFSGKLCIHPNQVAGVNQAFAPTDEQIAWAKRVLEAVAEGKGQAISLDGKMVDLPVILKAEKILQK